MSMKIFRFFLKIWIVLGSLAAFLGGWVLLGHSGKPVVQAGETTTSGSGASTVSQLAPLPTLAPLPSLSSGSTSQGLQPLAQQPSTGTTAIRPRLRTRGS